MKMFDAGKTGLIGLPYGKKNYDDMLSRFHPIPGRYGRTDRRTDGQNIKTGSNGKPICDFLLVFHCNYIL